jgi:hydrogenase-4 component F
MILLAYLIPGFIILLLMLRRTSSPAHHNNYLSILVIVHSAIYLLLTIAILLKVPLPVYAAGRYLFIDSLGIYEVLISSLVFLLSASYARGYVRSLMRAGEFKARELPLFYAAFSLLLMVVAAAFYSNNLALFWILLELTTVLSAVLIVTLNAKENIIAALKYLFNASTAMLFSIIGLIIIFAMTLQTSGRGTLNWDVLMQQAGTLSPAAFTCAFILVFVGFAAKAGIVPFHTWLPQAHAKAPSVISVLLSAVLLNIGTYGILRMFAVAHRTPAVKVISIILIVFGVLSIAVAALSMLPRGNVKKLIAFSSVENMGFILLGIGLGTPVVLFWVLFQTLAHSLVKTLLFFSAGIMHQQYGSNQFEDMKGALTLQPVASWGLIIGTCAIIGVPLFPVFLAKINILAQLANYSLPLLLTVLVLFLVAAAAFTTILIRTLTQKAESLDKTYRIGMSMKLPIFILFAGIVLMGLYLPDGYRQLLDGIVSSLGF